LKFIWIFGGTAGGPTGVSTGAGSTEVVAGAAPVAGASGAVVVAGAVPVVGASGEAVVAGAD
jgi:hypothetical protein